MFIEVYEESNAIKEINTNWINSKDIKRIFLGFIEQRSVPVYKLKIETYDKKEYYLCENICIEEAKYIVDMMINKIQKNELFNVRDIKSLYEDASFVNYYNLGVFETDENLDLIIEKVLNACPEWTEYSLISLSMTARRDLKEKEELFKFYNAISRYREALEKNNPEMLKYI